MSAAMQFLRKTAASGPSTVPVPTRCTSCQAPLCSFPHNSSTLIPCMQPPAAQLARRISIPPTTTVCAALAQQPAASTSEHSSSDDARAFAVAMAKVADDTKAGDISVLHVAPLVSWCSYMVLCTVMSKPQLLAVLGRMEDAAQDDWHRTKQNSAGASQWEVLDYGDVVVHVFTADQREHYDLDGFYAAAEDVPLPFLEEWAESSREAEQDNSSSSSGGQPMWSKTL